MISEAEAIKILEPLSPLEKQEMGRFIVMNNGGVRKFIYWSEVFSIFQHGKLDFSIEDSSRDKPFVLVNTESRYHPVSWPEEWGMMHIASSYMEEVYQRTCW